MFPILISAFAACDKKKQRSKRRKNYFFIHFFSLIIKLVNERTKYINFTLNEDLNANNSSVLLA